MADNTAAKSHLRTLESKLNDMRDLNNLSTIVHQSSLDLVGVLWSWKNLFVDADVQASVNSIVDRLEAGWWIETDLHAQYQSIANQYWAAVAWKDGNNVRNAMSDAWRELERKDIIHNTWSVAGAWGSSRTTALVSREAEFKLIQQHIDWFDPNFSVPDLNVNVTAPGWIINLSARRTGPAIPKEPKYELCDADGKSIWPNSWPHKIKIWGTEYSLSGIHWNNAAKTYDFTWLNIYPPLTNLPQTIDLSVSAVCSWVTNWINVIYNKSFKLTLNDWTPRVNSVASRNLAFDDYEASGWHHAISEQLNTKINVRDNDPEIGKNVLERKAIETALKYKWGTKYDTLSDKQKRLFYERVCRAWFFTPVYAAWWVIDIDNARYDKMKDWFTHGSRPWNNDKNTICSASVYKTYIHSHLDEKCDEYILTTLESYLQEDARNTALKAELSKFLQEIDNNKLDDDHLNTQIHRDLRDKRYKMNRWPISLFHPRDVNYMRFFSNSSISQKKQQVNIYSNIDNPEPVNYDMNLNITWKNNIEVEIKIDGTDEVIKQKSSQPSTLVRKIMREQRIKHGKVRAHIWFNIYKSIIQIAQEKNISLTYRGMEWKMRWNRPHKSFETRKIEVDKKWNIVIKQIDHLTTADTEKDIFVFDQNSFLNVNEFDNWQTNWILREWLETLWYHFNLAMNDVHKQYRKWTEKRVLWLVHSKSRMKLPTSFRLSPIKKILNCRTNTNFDFNTSVNSQWKNIKIDFRKNKFTIDMDWLKKPISSRDLGALLNHRQWKVRVFDGVERDIVEEIYSSLVNALRKNAKVARTSFWVIDDITWNMYVLDEDGKFWVIAREDFKWENKIKNPLRWIFRWRKNKWALKKKRFDEVSRRPLEPSEQKELLKNPFLMQKFVKAMNNRMWLWWSITGLFN